MAGFIIFEDVRRYAAGRIDPTFDSATRDAALKAIDDAIYGLMMVIDGVTGTLRSGDERVELRMHVRLRRDSMIVEDLDLFDGDGMCMGYHGWVKGDFGEQPITQSTDAT